MGLLHARVSVKTSKLWFIYQIAFECVTVYIATAAIATYVAIPTYTYYETYIRIYRLRIRFMISSFWHLAQLYSA